MTTTDDPVEQDELENNRATPATLLPGSSLSESNLLIYRTVLVLSIILASLSFSYNVWRLEVSEQNNTIRTAGMQVLIELSELEQLIFIAHYDKDLIAGNPRKSWVRVGLINDLSILISEDSEQFAHELKQTWQNQWSLIANDDEAVHLVGVEIDKMRAQVKQELKTLR